MVKCLTVEWKRRLTIAGIIAGVYLGCRYLLPVLLPFLAAWIFACWLYPAALKIEKKTKIKKTAAGAVMLAAMLAVLLLLLYWGVLEIFSQIRTAVSQYHILESWMNGFLNNCCSALEDATGINAAAARTYFLKQAGNVQRTLLSSVGTSAVSGVFSGFRSVFMLISAIVVVFIAAVLMIGDMENLRRKIWDHHWLMGTRRVVRRLKKTTVTYLKAQAVIMSLVAVICAAGLWVMKNPYFLILGILLGLLDALPLIGTGMFLYPAAIVLFIKGNLSAAVVCVVLDILTSLLREFLEPRLLGGGLGVSPIAVLGSVYIGLFLYGAWGVILGPLSFSIMYEIGKEWDVWD